MITLEEKKILISTHINNCKKKIWRLIISFQYEQAMAEIVELSDLLYNYNQYYFDAELEDYLRLLVKKVEAFKNDVDVPNITTDKKIVVFYDCFGLDIRGLANIYLDALIRQGYYVVYITYASAKNNIPTVEKILSAGANRMLFLPLANNLVKYQLLSACLHKIKPEYAFLYTYPNDVSGIMAFMNYTGQGKRYLVNLTDHAFWLGVNAFDYCLEFRDYGASISSQYRGIPYEKLLCQPYYPYVDYSRTFEGFPFSKEKDDFVIFSGGRLCKTIDSTNSYYKLLEYVLDRYTNVKLWYAGYGNDSDSSNLKKLIAMYPNRVFWTGERKDLFQLLQHVDIYFNTFPIAGGLMTQYAAMAGKVPLTLIDDTEEFTGLLLNQEQCGVGFSTIESFIAEFDRLISDKVYLQFKNDLMKKSVISAENFSDNLKLIMENDYSAFPVSIYKINVDKFLQNYAENFLKNINCGR